MVHRKKISLRVISDKILFKCPECKKKTKANVAKFKGRKTLIKIRCHCKDIFRVKLNFPQTFQNLYASVGELINLTRGSLASKITMRKVTPTNLEVNIKGRHLPRRGDKVKIKYTDPLSHETVLQKATVMRVTGKLAACFKI